MPCPCCHNLNNIAQWVSACVKLRRQFDKLPFLAGSQCKLVKLEIG